MKRHVFRRISAKDSFCTEARNGTPRDVKTKQTKHPKIMRGKCVTPSKVDGRVQELRTDATAAVAVAIAIGKVDELTCQNIPSCLHQVYQTKIANKNYMAKRDTYTHTTSTKSHFVVCVKSTEFALNTHHLKNGKEKSFGTSL